MVRCWRLVALVLHLPIESNEISVGTRRFGTFRSGFRPPLRDELGNQIAIFRDVAGNDALSLLQPFLSRFSVHDQSQMIERGSLS